MLANLACHEEVRRGLLDSAALAELVMERALWVDDTPSLGEACRLLSGLCLGTQVGAPALSAAGPGQRSVSQSEVGRRSWLKFVARPAPQH
jgi:hypothetical protein